ncbi:putative transposase (fragment) [Bradyrhizobium sp. ORS 285]
MRRPEFCKWPCRTFYFIGRFSWAFGTEATMNVRYHVDLSSAEGAELELFLAGGSQAVRKLKRAQILLAADAGMSDADIATNVGVGHSTVYRTGRRIVEDNLTAALSEEPRAGAERKLTDKQEALLVATACSSPPAGRGALDAGASGRRDS